MSAKRINQEDWYKNLGENVTAARKFQDLSIVKLSKIAGVSRATIHNIENGRQTSAYTIQCVADALGVSIDDIVQGCI